MKIPSNKLLTAALTLVLLSTGSLLVHAEIYKRVDENGHITYSNVPLKGAKKLNLDPPAPSRPASNGDFANKPNSATKSPTPASFPKVDSQTQNSRDDKRKTILSEELSNERKALDEAKKALDEGKANPEMVTGANGKRFRNMAKYDEKVKKLEEDVEAHERNIELLQKELDANN